MKSTEQHCEEYRKTIRALLQHEAELRIINIVQETLLKEVETDVTYQLAGNYIRDMFDVQAVTLSTFGYENNGKRFRNIYENEQRALPDTMTDLSCKPELKKILDSVEERTVTLNRT